MSEARRTLRTVARPGPEFHGAVHLTLARQDEQASVVEARSRDETLDLHQHDERLIHNAHRFRRLPYGGEGKDFVVGAQVFTGWFGIPMRVRQVLDWLTMKASSSMAVTAQLNA